MTEHTKDVWGFSLATVMVVTGIILAFISFLTLTLIHSSILLYIGMGLSFFGALMGISMKFNGLEGQFQTKLKNLEERIDNHIDKRMKENETEQELHAGGTDEE